MSSIYCEVCRAIVMADCTWQDCAAAHRCAVENCPHQDCFIDSGGATEIEDDPNADDLD